MQTKSSTEQNICWHTIENSNLQLCGLPFYFSDKVFRRLPANPVPAAPNEGVEHLSWHTAGAQLRFRSDASKVVVRAESRFDELMDHMPQTGICGCDIYVAESGQPLRFFGVSRYKVGELKYECELFNCQSEQKNMREFVINLPLYNGITSIEVGLELDAKLEPPTAWSYDGKIVWYGTSIQQGGCASRPGMCVSNILSRKLNCEIVNLAFSGSGRGESAMADLMLQVPNPQIFVLDYEANAMTIENLTATLPVLIDKLREAYPEITILVISRICFAQDGYSIDNTSKEFRLQGLDIQRNEVAKRVANGDKNIYFIDGGELLGEDFWECTVDGIHPTDLGFYRIAENLEERFFCHLKASKN